MGESEPVAGRDVLADAGASAHASPDGRPPRLLAGAMSGTSGDGVDVAITSITGRGLGMKAKLVRHHHVPYDAELKRLLFSIREAGTTSLADLARLGREISLTYARAVNEALNLANLHARDIAAIAAHGQTLYHAPPNTIQWLDPSLLAAETGCSVVSDFRRADLAAGGQGAPLVPYADYILFRHPTKNRVLLNIGGIANITYLRGGGSIDTVVAFDTGPGNCVSDHMMTPSIDVNGRLAARGRVEGAVLRDALADDYFDRPPPKSTDGPAMIALFDRARQRHPNITRLTDSLATACALTALSISQAIVRHSPNPVDEVFASGGGTRNVAIMSSLRSEMGDVPVRMVDELGAPSEAKEALAFALLAAATLDGEPSNVPSVTGARQRVVLGSITPVP